MQSLNTIGEWMSANLRRAPRVFVTLALVGCGLSARAATQHAEITVTEAAVDTPGGAESFTVATTFDFLMDALLPHTVLLTEPSSGGQIVSDFVTVSITPNPTLKQSAVTFLFESDGAVGFDAAVAALKLLPTTATLEEDGTVQDVSAQLGSSPSLIVKIQSDFTPSEAVPDAASTVILLGLSFLSIAAFARRARLFRPAL